MLINNETEEMREFNMSKTVAITREELRQLLSLLVKWGTNLQSGQVSLEVVESGLEEILDTIFG